LRFLFDELYVYGVKYPGADTGGAAVHPRMQKIVQASGGCRPTKPLITG